MIQSTLQIAATESVLVPEHVLASVLALFAVAGLLVLAGGAAGVGLALRRRRVAVWAAVVGAAAAAVYGAALFGSAAVSRDRTLPPGARKYFCEIDCHAAYSLEGASAPGPATRLAIRTWFDPSTISSRRGNAALTPNPRVAWVVDAAGTRYFPVAGASGVDSVAGFERVLRPGESYRTILAFDLPSGILRPRLFVGAGGTVERFLIGHENSPGHGRTYFALP